MKKGIKINSVRHIRGASMIEFVISAPVILLLGLGTIQMALIYQGKSTVNYATFEAARAGAVDHAKIASMREELGVRLAPLLGGDGSIEKAASAILVAKAHAQDPVRTTLEIINPTHEAFTDWGVPGTETDGLVIPNSHLRHKDKGEIGSNSGVNLHDANLLKVAVTYGMEMKIPIIAPLMSKAMTLVDPENAHFYAQSQFPLSSVATVRMQSESWQNEAMISTSSTPGGDADAEFIPDDSALNEQDASNVADADSSECVGPHGLPIDLTLMNSGDAAIGMCSATDLSYGEPGGAEGSSPSLGAGCG